jgi:hypothetical protein
VDHELTAIHCEKGVRFVKNGNFHNNKNAAFVTINRYKEFILNDKNYGNQDNFTKQTWRRFVKLQAFL